MGCVVALLPEHIEERWDQYLGAVVEVVARVKAATTVQRRIGARIVPTTLTHLVSDVAPVNSAVRDGTELRGRDVKANVSCDRTDARECSRKGHLIVAIVNACVHTPAKWRWRC